MRLCLALTLAATPALADPPVIEAVVTERDGDGWRFSVTIAHPDTGWDHYADGWRVETSDGTVLGTRELLHPHETEQPFTRSLSGVAVPEGTGALRIRARCNVEGWSEETAEISPN